MKKLLAGLFICLSSTFFAQNLEVNSTNLPFNGASLTHSNASSLKTTSCGVDTNGYALAKATGIQALNINNATSASAISQFFDAPQPITISGVSFYAWKANTTGGLTLNATVSVYAAAADSTPSGAPLATTTVVVDTTFGGGALAVIRKHATFATPITTASNYVIVIANNSANSMSMVFNSWTAGDGAQEWLSSALLGANWIRSYALSIGGVPLDADGLIEPHTSYSLTASFNVSDACFASGLNQTFTNTSSPVNTNRMYNVAAYLTTPELSFTWDYGDGSPTQNAVDGAHTYGVAGAYTVTLTDTLYGWTTNCITDTSFTFSSGPTASFTTNQSGLTANFTSTSTTNGSPSYFWDFGDGNTSTSTNPTHTYPSVGFYTACLVVNDACGADTICQVVNITSCTTPTAGFTSIENPIGSGTFDFTNTSSTTGATSYSWDFGDGNTSTSTNPSHSYSTAGSYSVTLSVTDSCGTNTITQSVNTTVSTADLFLETVSVYPNPANEFISIVSSSAMKSLVISDLAGKIVFVESLSGNSHTVNSLNMVAGSYFVSVIFENNAQQTVRLEILN